MSGDSSNENRCFIRSCRRKCEGVVNCLLSFISYNPSYMVVYYWRDSVTRLPCLSDIMLYNKNYCKAFRVRRQVQWRKRIQTGNITDVFSRVLSLTYFCSSRCNFLDVQIKHQCIHRNYNNNTGVFRFHAM